MSYSDPQYGEEPYVGYRKVKARKDWPCAYAKQGNAGDEEPQCDGTIHPGEEYVDETLAPWTPEYDETGEDGYGRPTFGQVGVLGQWQHTRYHELCERRAIQYREYGTPAQQAAEQAAEKARAAKEQADMDRYYKEAAASQRRRQQHNSKRARREREEAAVRRAQMHVVPTPPAAPAPTTGGPDDT